MKFTQHSPISFTPDHGWIAEFRTDEEAWQLPVLGWAIVVDWIGRDVDPDNEENDDDDHKTSIEAVVLLDGKYPLIMREYFEDLADPTKIKTELKRAG